MLRRFLPLYTILLVALSLTLILMPLSVKKSFAVQALSIGVYWNASYTVKVTSINWGELAPGSVSSVNVYARNEELTVPCFLFLSTESWTPSTATRNIKLSWNYDEKPIAPGKSVPITLTLQISEDIIGVTDFSFSIVILATEHLVGDLNHDGRVDMHDVGIICRAFGITPSSPSWNPETDINNDLQVDMRDVSMVVQNFGLSA